MGTTEEEMETGTEESAAETAAEAPETQDRVPAGGSSRMTFFQSLGELLASLSLFIDRYIHRRQCPYCFSYVTKRVYERQQRPYGPIRIRGIRLSLPDTILYRCPTCNESLPSDFFASRSTSIALVGGTESGKSSFITLFCELLLYRRSQLSDLGIFGTIVNSDGRQTFESNRSVLIRQERTLPGTNQEQRPIVVRLHSAHHRKVTYISLMDSPGEHFTNIEDLLKMHSNLQYAQGIIFLMNPLDIAEIFRLILKEKPGTLPPNLDPNARNMELIETLYQLYIQTGRVKPNRRIKIPTAFCLSRADLLEDITQLYIPPDFDPDYGDIRDILEEGDLTAADLRELIEEMDPSLLNIMEKQFRKYGLFPVSPLGKAPSGDSKGQRIPGGVEPKGVLQPIIWLLRQTKFISTV